MKVKGLIKYDIESIKGKWLDFVSTYFTVKYVFGRDGDKNGSTTRVSYIKSNGSKHIELHRYLK